MKKCCANCSADFVVDEKQLSFLERVSPIIEGKVFKIPPPTLCPKCRLVRKMSQRAWWYVGVRTCSKTGQRIFSHHLPNETFPVYANDEWWSDRWDPMDYRTEFDFSRPFFSQFRELSDRVPRPARSFKNLENSDYCNNAVDLKDCYLCFGTADTQSCLYSDGVTSCKDCIDVTMTRYSELCYDCFNCNYCYNLQSSLHSQNCQDSYFLFNCKSCHHCFGCINLRHQSYCIFNEQLSKEEYERTICSFNLGSFSERELLRKKAQDFFFKHPVPHTFNANSEKVTGNFISGSSQIERSFFITKCENLTYSYGSTNDFRDCYDLHSGGGPGELLYESATCGLGAYHLSFCRLCLNSSRNLLYCIWCSGCIDCFGCVGLTKKQYCILNKQFSKDDYEILLPKILAQLEANGEWGEFFPMADSDFPYNHTIAQLFFPLSAGDAAAKGVRWHETELVDNSDSVNALDHPDTVPISNESFVLRSKISSQLFKVTSEELKVYRRLNIPVPQTAYFERMRARMSLSGGIDLYHRRCAKSGREIVTTISPESPWIVWDATEFERQFS